MHAEISYVTCSRQLLISVALQLNPIKATTPSGARSSKELSLQEVSSLNACVPSGLTVVISMQSGKQRSPPSVMVIRSPTCATPENTRRSGVSQEAKEILAVFPGTPVSVQFSTASPRKPPAMRSAHEFAVYMKIISLAQSGQLQNFSSTGGISIQSVEIPVTSSK